MPGSDPWLDPEHVRARDIAAVKCQLDVIAELLTELLPDGLSFEWDMEEEP